MSLPYLKKIDNSDSEPSAYSFIHPSAILYDRPALRLANRLRWDRLNIVPELQRLFCYYPIPVLLQTKPRDLSVLTMLKLMTKLARFELRMWSIDRLNEVKQLNYYSRGWG